MINEYYTFELNENVERAHVSFKNRYGITIAADLYTPKNMDKTKHYPALVVGPPYGGVKEQGPGVYANQMSQRGFVVLAIDPSFNGYSEGQPRHVSSPDIFTEDFSAAVDYIGTRSFVNRDQIGAIGICGSGGFALSAAQVDTRIKAIATASLIDISSNFDALTAEQRTAMLDEVSQQRWVDFENGEPEYIPTFPSEPDTQIPEGLDPMSAEFYSYYGLERGHHPNATANFTTTSTTTFMNYNLLDHLDTISPRPVLLLVGENAMTKGLSEVVYEQLSGSKELVVVPGANHVDLYDQVDSIPFDKLESFFKDAFEA
ncbi:hypothetical protein AWJ19_31755 [Paenibacillus sp. DMB5]|nr:hypothetical protein AWJ19_31755 [Paenibacillus sp. DMB5]